MIQLEAGRHEVENAYERIVTYEGNRPAQKLLAEVFEVTDRAWRGIGVIPKSGWRLSEAYRDFDAEERFQISGHSYRGVAAVPLRRRAARGHQAGRVRGLRQGMHAAPSAGRDHGFKRRRLRGLLQLRAVFVRGGAGRRGKRVDGERMAERCEGRATLIRDQRDAGLFRLVVPAAAGGLSRPS